MTSAFPEPRSPDSKLVYSVAAHLSMVTDPVRTPAYRDALERAVQPGFHVADIGTGTGIFALLACRLGAERVYAIEPDPVIEVARQVAADNGFLDQITFISERSTDISLPTPVDLIVADVGGVLPLFENAIGTLADARKRFLAEGGGMIPAREMLKAALVESRDPFPHDTAALDEVGLDMSAAVQYSSNLWQRAHLGADELLTEPQTWTELHYATVVSPHVAGHASATVTRDGTARGLCVWFDRELVEGVGFSNAPGEPRAIYGQACFPLEAPVEVCAGDRMTVEIEAHEIGDDYVWRWSSRIESAGSAGGVKAEFEQSTIRAAPVSIARLRRREAGFQPERGEDAEIDNLILSSMNGSTSLEAIAEHVSAGFPSRFNNASDALARVAQLSEKYSRKPR